MNNIERLELISRIGRELQDRMTFDDIDVYLKGFGVKTSSTRDVNSKWVYTKDLLADASKELVVRIADELGLAHSHVVLPGRTVNESRFWEAGHFRLFLILVT